MCSRARMHDVLLCECMSIASLSDHIQILKREQGGSPRGLGVGLVNRRPGGAAPRPSWRATTQDRRHLRLVEG